MYKLECPYCECMSEYDLTDYLNGDDFDIECNNCNEEFEVCVEYEPSFSESKIEYYNCCECKNKYRHTGDWKPYPKKYQNIKNGLCICRNCIYVLNCKDYKKEQKSTTKKL